MISTALLLFIFRCVAHFIFVTLLCKQQNSKTFGDEEPFHALHLSAQKNIALIHDMVKQKPLLIDYSDEHRKRHVCNSVTAVRKIIQMNTEKDVANWKYKHRKRQLYNMEISKKKFQKLYKRAPKA